MTRLKSHAADILGWWRTWLHDPQSGEARALSARLRRATQPLEVLSEERVFELKQKSGCSDPLKLAALAMILASVKEHNTRSLPRMLGAGDPRPLSDLRFQRLIRTLEPIELAQAIRRALPLVGNTCNVASLGSDVLQWDEATRIRWCFDYFGAPAPGTTTQPEPSAEEETTA